MVLALMTEVQDSGEMKDRNGNTFKLCRNSFLSPVIMILMLYSITGLKMAALAACKCRFIHIIQTSQKTDGRLGGDSELNRRSEWF
jgi:hypothetical protein